MRRSLNWTRILLLAALALVLVVPWSVLADYVTPDGDEVVVRGSNYSLGLGDEVCEDATIQSTVVIAIERHEGTNSGHVFKDGTTVTISATTSDSQLTVAIPPDGNEISIPSNWSTQDNGTLTTGSVSSTVTFHPTTTGSFSGTITYTAAGTDAKSPYDPLTRMQTVSVEVDVIDCSTPPSDDTTDPVTTIALSPTSPDGNNDWYVSNVHVSVSATDNVGVVETRCVLDPTTTPTEFADLAASCAYGSTGADVSADGEHVVWAGSIDAAGNWDLVSASFKIDQTPPELNVSGADDGTNYSYCGGTLPTEPSFAPTDATSGIDTGEGATGDEWATPNTANHVGTYTYYAWATDNAGNFVDETRTYTVTYGDAFSGFLPPVLDKDVNGHFKLRSTIPIKFALSCGGEPILGAVANLYVWKVDSDAETGPYEVASTSAATSGNLFRYDSVSEQYIFNLSTKAGYENPDDTWVVFSTGTWKLQISLDDGTTRTTYIELK